MICIFYIRYGIKINCDDKAGRRSLSLLVDLLVELVLAEEKRRVEVVKALAVALRLWLGHGCLVVAEADLVAENGEIHRMLHLL